MEIIQHKFLMFCISQARSAWTWGGQGPAPMVILDYGRDVADLPVFEVSAVSGTPQLQAIYSESQQNLLPAGDGAPGFPNAPGDPWEALAPNGTPQSPSTSLAHAWSSGPTSALSKYVLGVRPVEPGYKTWLIEPQIGDLTWATGTVPTPYGPIAVAWQKTSKGFRLEINVPAGTSGTVGVPRSSNADAVTDNGRPIEKRAASVSDNSVGSRPGYAYFAELRPGPHVIQVMEGKN
jgi:Bacterial alpha-L-rhamnosidase C-terminal domain